MVRTRLLVVEDNVIAAEGLRLALKEHNFDVEVVNSGREVVGILIRRGADALLLDLTLPDIDGATVAELIRRDWPELPIVLTSGYARPSRIEPLLRNDRTTFVQKPFDVDRLIAVLNGVMRTQAVSARR